MLSPYLVEGANSVRKRNQRNGFLKANERTNGKRTDEQDDKWFEQTALDKISLSQHRLVSYYL